MVTNKAIKKCMIELSSQFYNTYGDETRQLPTFLLNNIGLFKTYQNNQKERAIISECINRKYITFQTVGYTRNFYLTVEGYNFGIKHKNLVYYALKNPTVPVVGSGVAIVAAFVAILKLIYS